jgi:hypothetical protein
MKSTHNMFRALSLGLGLTLLMITGTAAMMAVFSSPLPNTPLYRPVVIAPTPDPSTQQAMEKDGKNAVLDERWVRADEVAPTSQALADTTQSIYAGGAQNISYTLRLKPAGLNKAPKSCVRTSAYDISCHTLS